ncbi:efflux RND transporter periplasmic adaptor subunit [Lysobacter sp. H21R4]|uniref:efflux RND transporter periplasmic adaptor subunit n=1 Tax=Lysobacter sp. H21R4 TaxID=2781021 RepID=UPI0018892E2A|nr:efflux RND transporter periplasmic adaptor subunit [Lysobacter sp. H21R4]QOY62324.1 efflux RND transporter periplasmic adaptor subunit [Lysobacter sp. H21R4]
MAGGLLALVVAGVYFWQQRASGDGAGDYRTATAERGDVRVSISATGTLGAISTVDVGSQISGLVTEVLADFNDTVSKGQVIARIDPSTFDAQIAQGNAAVQAAQASLATARAAAANAEADFRRKTELGERQLVASSDIDLARTARDQARAQVQAAQAQITQQRASTRTSQLNLDRTEIRSPVDGVVLTRTVEPGQTVAASLQAPVLFQIAEDLSKMEIVLAIDEADIGQVKTGQGVSFGVDAFPDRQFRGSVQQVRLSATNTNNVITYPVVVAVDNPDQILLPGMTANAEIEVSRRDDVLRVPNAALRYKPAEGDAAAPPTATRASPTEELPRIAAALELDAHQQAAFDEALAGMRERAAARATAAPSRPPAGGPPMMGGGRGPANAGAGNSGAMRQRMQERFTQQFAAFRETLPDEKKARWDGELASLLAARRAPLYLLVAGKPKPITVRLGVSDGSWTEVAGDIAQGDQVIIGSGRPAR